MIKFLLFWEFFKTGLFAVGGGLATIPFLSEMGEKFGWFTVETLSMMIAVSESTPGPIGINMATYVGYLVDGISGSLIATLSLVAPSVIIICVIANYFQKFKEAKIVKMLFAGLKPAVVAFIAAACIDLFQSTLMTEGNSSINVPCLLLFLGLIAVNRKCPKLHPIVYIFAAACLGIIFRL